MFNTAPKRIGWFCLFCVSFVVGLFCIKIVWPSLSQPRFTQPFLEFHLMPQRVGSVAFTPDGSQLLCKYYLNGVDEIKRWNTSDGKEISSIKKAGGFLSEDGPYYVAPALPNNPKDTILVRVIGGEHPVAIYFFSKSTKAEEYADLFNLTRRYLFWDIETKHFLSNTPRTTKLYDFQETDPMDVAFSDDGSKVLSLWPTYTRTDNNKTITVTKNFIPWFEPNYRQKPKEASLLNEVNGEIISLPLPEESLPFDFGWRNFALSANQKYFAAASARNPTGWALDGNDGTIWCYDLPNRNLKWRYPPRKNLPETLRFSPDGTMLAVSGSNYDYRYDGFGFLSVIDVSTGKFIHNYTEQTWWQQIQDRTQFAFLNLLNYNPSVRKLFRHIADSIAHSIPPGNSGRIESIVWSPDSKTLAASYYDGSVKIWRVKK